MNYCSDKILRACVFFFLLLLVSVQAATYYISPSGRKIASGTVSDPFGSVDAALSRHGGGHTYIFKPGIYTGQITVRPEYRGTPENPTILKSQEKHKAIIHGSMTHNVYINEGCDWVIVDGFVSSGANFAGIKANGGYNVIRNCWILNNADGIEAHSVKGTVIENNLIEYNGRHLQFDHGVYADGDGLIIRNNIVRFNASFGLHLYSSISNSRIENNLVYGNNRPGIAVFGDGIVGNNVIVNNTVVRNGSGIQLSKSKSDVVYNNIAVENISTWRWSNEQQGNIAAEDIVVESPVDINSVKMDYNLCSAKSRYCGPHTRIQNPKFLSRMKGLFYLNADSPAIGKGSSKYYAERDFFGNPRDPNAIDLGCFAFYNSLLDKEYRKGWNQEWPYHFRDQKSISQIPDLWASPSN